MCDTEYKPGELQGSGGGGVTRNTNQGSGRGVAGEWRWRCDTEYKQVRFIARMT